MRRLPYLNGIRAFEASARAGSFRGCRQGVERHAGGDQPDGAAAGAAARRRPVRARGEPPRFDAGGPQLPGRADADLRCAREPDRPGEDAGKPGADRRGRADLCDPLADPAPRRVRQDRARGRRAHHHRRGRGAVQRRLDLRHQARRRRLAGARRRAAVRRGPDAGVRAAGRGADQVARNARGRDAAARRARAGRLAALARGCRTGAGRERTGVRILRPRAAGRDGLASASRSASGPTSTTISRPGGWSRRSGSRCRRASNGIWCSASRAARSRAFWRSAAGFRASRAGNERKDAQSRSHPGRRRIRRDPVGPCARPHRRERRRLHQRPRASGVRAGPCRRDGGGRAVGRVPRARLRSGCCRSCFRW